MARAPIDSNHHKGLVARNAITGDELIPTGADLTNSDPLHVAIVDGSGNQVTSFGGSGGTSATDDAAFTPGSGSGTPMMGTVTADSVDAGDVGVIGMLANRQQKVTLYDSSGVELAVGGGTQYAEDSAHVSGNTGTMDLGVRNDAATVLAGTDGDYTPKAVTGEGYTQIGSGFKLVSGTATALNDDVIASTDVGNYRWVSLQLTGTWTGTVTFQTSNDNTNWASMTMVGSTQGGNSHSTTGTINAMFNGHCPGRYFRARFTTATSGTVSGSAIFSASPGAYQTFGIGNISPGSSAANLGKAEDAGHTTGDTGVFMLGVRNDAQTTLTSTDLDYSPIGTDGPGNVRMVGNIADAATDAGAPVKVGAKYNATVPTYTDGQRGDLQIGSRGSLRTELSLSGSTSTVTGTVNGADGLSNTFNALNFIARSTVFNGSTWDRLAGNTSGLYAQGNVADAATDAGNPIKVGAKYNATRPTYTDGQRGDLQIGSRGSLRIQLAAADSNSTHAQGADNTDAAAVSATVDKYQLLTRNTVYNGTSWDRMRGDTTGVYVQERASATGGYTPGKLISAASTNATSVKASAGTLGYITASNINAAARYLKIYNKATAPTVGTDTPVAVFLIPGNTAGAGTNIPLPPQGMALGTGIAFAITTGVADSDTGAVAANELIINYGTA